MRRTLHTGYIVSPGELAAAAGVTADTGAEYQVIGPYSVIYLSVHTSGLWCPDGPDAGVSGRADAL